MKKLKRVFLIVADSMGVGAAPDAADFANGDGTDEGADTYGALCRSDGFSAPFLTRLGIGNISGVDASYPKCQNPIGAFGKMREASAGKDTVTGHWEIAGVSSESAMPTFPDGFPEDFLEELSRKWGRGWLCNKPYSGTEVIKDYGEEHIKTGKLIVYTSADSVFQIAAHEDVVSVEELYRCCETAREALCGTLAVGRVSARPFAGEYPFTRTPTRRDYALSAHGDTVCDEICAAGLDVIGIGKIGDIFAHRGISEEIHTVSNTDGMNKTAQLQSRDFRGLCFVNLVDFDMKYGHRRDTEGYAAAVTEFDAFLEDFCAKLGEDDCVIVTADHGCDPSHIGTDHTREYVPVLVYGRRIRNTDLRVRLSFADLGATCEELLGVEGHTEGESFASLILKG